jgi:hypothetical protein
MRYLFGAIAADRHAMLVSRGFACDRWRRLSLLQTSAALALNHFRGLAATGESQHEYGPQTANGCGKDQVQQEARYRCA